MQALDTSTKVTVIDSLKTSQEKIPLEAQKLAQRILIFGSSETLVLLSRFEKKVYIVFVSGNPCSQSILKSIALSSGESGEVEGHRWKRIVGGPSVFELKKLMDAGKFLWSSF